MRAAAATHDARDTAAGDRAQQASQADDCVDAFGLSEGVEVADDAPELHRRERADQPRPDIEGPERPGAERRTGCPEQKRPSGADGEKAGERTRAVQSA